jgi:hypothetical protein
MGKRTIGSRIKSSIAKGLVGLIGIGAFVGGEANADRIQIGVGNDSGYPGSSFMEIRHQEGATLDYDSGIDKYWFRMGGRPPGSPNDWLRVYSDQINIIRNRTDREMQTDARPFSGEYTNKNFPLRLDTQYQDTGEPEAPLTSSNNYILLQLLDQNGPDEGMGRDYYVWNMSLTNGAEFADGTFQKSGVWNLNEETTHTLPFYHLDNVLGLYGYLDVLPTNSPPSQQVQLIINSPHGTPNPSGTNHYDKGSSVNVSIAGSPKEISELERLVAEGWTLSGGQSDSGMGTNAVFTINNNANLDWNWKTQYWYTATANGNGALSGITNGWHNSGELIETTAHPDQYYKFDGWTGTTNSNSNPLSIFIYQPYSVVANINAKRTSMGTTESWLAEHGLTPENDEDMVNNYLVWQHYQLDTTPKEGEPYFHMAIEPEELVFRNTSPNVEYGADFRDSLTEGNWNTNYVENVEGQVGETRVPRSLGVRGFYRGKGRRIEE